MSESYFFYVALMSNYTFNHPMRWMAFSWWIVIRYHKALEHARLHIQGRLMQSQTMLALTCGSAQRPSPLSANNGRKLDVIRTVTKRLQPFQAPLTV